MKTLKLLSLGFGFLLASQAWGQDSSGVTRLSTLYNSWDHATDVVVAGDFAYVADGYAGLRVVDVSNPAQMVETGYCDTPGKATYVQVEGDYAYVTTRDSGIYVINITNPEHPRRVIPSPIPGRALKIWIFDNFAYVLEDSVLSVMDISEPIEPEVLGTCPIRADGCVKVGDYLYLTYADSLHILDVSDPAEIYQAGVYFDGFRFEHIATDGRFIYMERKQEWKGAGILDLTNPLELRLRGSREYIEGYSIYTFVAANGFLYVGCNTNGLHIYDVSDPDTLIRKSVGTYVNVYSVFLSGDLAFLAVGSRLTAVDFTNINDLQIVGEYTRPGRYFDVTLYDHYAFVAAGSEGLRVVDVSNPVSPSEVSSFEPGIWLSSVLIKDSLLFVGTYFSDPCFYILNIADPRNPRELGRIWSDGSLPDIAFYEHYAYVLSNDGITVYDIANPSIAEPIGVFQLETYFSHIAIEGRYLYVTNPGFGLRILDLNEPTRPVQVGVWAEDASTLDVRLLGNYAYVVSNPAGLRILDVSDKTHPFEVGSFNTRGGISSVEIHDNHAYVGDIETGVHIFDLADPEHPVESGHYYSSGRAAGLAVGEDGLFYFADHFRLNICDASEALAANTNPSLSPSSLSLSLSPPFPSPFNSSVTISFTVGQVSKPVRLAIYDLSGRLVADLTHSEFRTPHSALGKVVWDAKDMPAGVYVVRLEGAGKSLSRKLVLMR